MTTQTKSAKKAAPSPKEGNFTDKDIVKAVRRAFLDWDKRIDPRHLWSDVAAHRFRVNLWDTEKIVESFFVWVTENDGKLQVEICNDK